MTRWIEASGHDLRYAVRGLRKSPGFTLVALLTLAIGIGSTTAVFSVINGILLRPLPYPDQNRLIALSNVYANRPEHSALVSGTDVAHWKVDNQVFENLDFVSHPDIVAMSSAGSGERVAVQHISAQLLQLLGIKSFLGTIPSDDVSEKRGALGVLISYEFWKRHFAGDRNVLGQKMFVDTWLATIIAVLTFINGCLLAQPDPREISIDFSDQGRPLLPFWAYFGYDEPNYTYMKDGKKLLSEIAALKSKRSDRETVILEFFEREEALVAAAKQAEQRIAEEEKRLKAGEADLEKEGASLDQSIHSIRVDRDSVRPKITATILARYDRLCTSRDGIAVAEIKKSACGACFKGLTPQAAQEARRMDAVMQCEQCGRLLVWTEGSVA